ncbi:MAG: MBL fold metallo-hydrolase [Solirubrobacterales bacterium]|nr:MBL fold metallo-hydrolase [Solirubrobacterales bacterium]MCB8971299.1 MBL fold metallo-hydrolase [Thermoleophilales bacterium]MCO5325844.1 MBL fold metallo-hydrolase [Solirubrobacterales bacterium]
MSMHSISAGTMCPLGAKYFTGDPGLGRGLVVCHCLVIESSDGLVLVDTGMGTEDMRHPYRRLGAPFKVGFGVKVDPTGTAIERIRGLGLDPADVRHIVPTHLDLDHAGGLPDFPSARVHVTADEHRVAINPSLRDRARYRHFHFDHGPRWRIHQTGAGGDRWFGFQSVRVLPGVDPEVLLIPLPGHSAGHTGVAVRDGDGWLLHCGDAYFNRCELETPPVAPKGIAAFEGIIAADNDARLANQQRLRELAAAHSDEVRLVCAHDHVELEGERTRAD